MGLGPQNGLSGEAGKTQIPVTAPVIVQTTITPQVYSLSDCAKLRLP